MSVATSTYVQTYSGNGSTTAFPSVFEYLDAADLDVVITQDSDSSDVTSDYTITKADGKDADGIPGTGTVTISPAPASGTTVTITRDTAITQANVITKSGPFPAKIVEAQADRGTLVAQEIDGRLATAESTLAGFSADVTAADEDAATATTKASEAAASATAAAASASQLAASYVQASPSVIYEWTVLDGISGDFDGADTTFDLEIGATAFTPASAAALMVFVNSVYQLPTTDYTVSGSEITFTTAPESTDSCFIIASKTATGTLEITPTAFMLAMNENDNSAASVMTRLGFSAYFQTIIGAANGAALKSSLSITDTEAVLDDISGGFDGAETEFALAVSAAAFTPSSAAALVVMINGIRQTPGTDYTVATTNITFTTAPESSDACEIWAISN